MLAYRLHVHNCARWSRFQKVAEVLDIPHVINSTNTNSTKLHQYRHPNWPQSNSFATQAAYTVTLQAPRVAN